MIGLSSRSTEEQWGLIAVAILTVFVIAPVFLVDIPAMYDYPNHLARLHVIVDEQRGVAHPYYETAWSWIPNLAFDLLVPPLARFSSVATATKALFILSELLIVTGAIALEYAVKRRHEFCGFTALLLLYSTPFAAGLLNFEFAMGVALWGMAGWIALRQRSTIGRLAFHSIFVAGLAVLHLGALALYGATIALYEAHKMWTRGKCDRRALINVVLIVAPAAIVLLAMKWSSGTIGSGASVWAISVKVLFLIGWLNGYSLAASVAGTFVLCAGILKLRRAGALKILDGGKWIGLGLLALFLLSPLTLLGSFFADARVLIGLMLIMPAFVAMREATSRIRLVTTTTLVMMAVGTTLITASVWMNFDPDFRVLVSSFRRLPDKPIMLVGEAEGPEALFTAGLPFGHAPTLAVHYSNALVPSFIRYPARSQFD